MLKNGTPTYVSLFSCAGVGCFGFKQEQYECIATCELVERRLAVQKINGKCTYDSGYIVGDLSTEQIKNQVYREIQKWKRLGNDRVDVVMATPPCQGISVINHKKNPDDLHRNSLVVESIEMVKTIHPRFFLFENVQGFLKTLCVDRNEELIPISDCIFKELGKDYIISGNVFNLMNRGSNSSRTRTIVIGVSKDFKNTIAPFDLFPKFVKEKTLGEVIDLNKKLEWGEISESDFYHAFRTYDEKMRPWIHDLKPGESAFGQTDPNKRPHRVIDGELVINTQKTRDKYTRQPVDRFVQCVHTRNDQLAAQNTIHPYEDRVFSIRELMEFMTIPSEFKWVDYSLEELNRMTLQEKQQLYKKNEMNIRQCIGEAIPTAVIRQIAANIKDALKSVYSSINVQELANQYELNNLEKLGKFIRTNPLNLDLYTLLRIVELLNTKRETNSAYYTNKFLVNEMMNQLPTITKGTIRILEPAVGAGNFIPMLIEKYSYAENVEIDVVDIDPDAIFILKEIVELIEVPDNVHIHYYIKDFLMMDIKKKYDLCIGNPPFTKIRGPYAKSILGYEDYHCNDSRNLFAYFFEKCIINSDFTAMVLNKTLLNSNEFFTFREWLRSKSIQTIIDFGRSGFSGLSIETISVFVESNKKPSKTKIINLKNNTKAIQQQSYITDPAFPRFLIYRDNNFDIVYDKLILGVFEVFRDRQITKSNTSSESTGNIWVLKSKNIDYDGRGTHHIEGYDRYISRDTLDCCSVSRFVDDDSVYLTPNMTYTPRILRNICGAVCDGSVAYLIPKGPLTLSQKQMDYYLTDEFRNYFFTAFNLSTQTINVDKNSVYFYGVLRDGQ